jgi:hypothetical protein
MATITGKKTKQSKRQQEVMHSYSQSMQRWQEAALAAELWQ